MGRRPKKGVKAKRNSKIATHIATLVGVFGSLVTLLSILQNIGWLPKWQAYPVMREKSVAILPFRNLSGNVIVGRMSIGLQTEILRNLESLKGLTLISGTSMMQYDTEIPKPGEIGRQVGAANVLVGNVEQPAGTKLRINAQLIDSRNDNFIWSSKYDRESDDLQGVQSEIANAIANQLHEKLAASTQPSPDPKAYNVYLRGLGFAANVSSKAADDVDASRAFSEAIEIDPNFALAWAALSRCDARLYNNEYEATPFRLEESLRALEKAEKLGADRAEVMLARAYYEARISHNYAAARRSFESAYQLLPSSSEIPLGLAKVTRRQGFWDESLARYKEASDRDPRNLEPLLEQAETNRALRQFPEAENLLNHALDIAKKDKKDNGTIAVIISTKAEIYQCTNRLNEADKLLKDLRAGPGEDGVLLAQWRQLWLQRRFAEASKLLRARLVNPDGPSRIEDVRYRVFIADSERKAGNVDIAKSIYLNALDQLKDLEQKRPESAIIPQLLAFVFAGLGDAENAIQKAERAMTLTPTSTDAYVGPIYEITLALVNAEVGNHEQAIAELPRLLKMPSSWAPPITPELLRVDPCWDSLRGDPRFEALVQKTSTRAQ